MSKSWGEIRDEALRRCGQKPPKTNADRIRALSDEELAKWFSQHLVVMTEYDEHPKRTKRWIDWLKQEVKEHSTT